MDFQMTQVLDEDKANDDNDDDTKVGILCVGTTEHSIVKGVTKIGRNRALCQIVINDLTVSNVHAEIQAGSETAFISDVRSANGTKIKDVQLKPFFYYTINDGDAIYLGIVKAIFKTKKSSQHSPLILPETPIPSRRLDETNTPGLGNASDFLFNNTSVYQSDDSLIPGTQQKGKKTTIFQEPTIPVDRRRVSNRISAVSSAASEKSNKETKSQNDVDFHDLETQKFAAIESPESNKTKQKDKATKSQNDVDSTDLHELETQKMDHDSILGESQSRNKRRTEKNQQYFDDTNIYDAETQILSHGMEIEEPKIEKKINTSRMNDSIVSSDRGNNSSSNFSRQLQISSTPSPPSSPNPLDESGEIVQSQNLLELCETPLLQLEKKANASGKSGESSKLKNSDKSDANTSEENSGAKSSSNSMENIVNSKNSVSSNHVIADSDDESATDDDLDIEIAKTNPERTKIGISNCRPSNVIEDDSATDDEGEFESLAAKSPPIEKRTLSLKMRPKTTENRDVEAKISEAETQIIDKKKYKLGDAKFRKETTEDRNSEANVFDAETQRMDQEFSAETVAKKRETAANIIDGKAKRMELKLHAITGAKKRHQIAEDHETDENIFEAETQKIHQENPAEVVAKNRETEANIFDAETQQMEPTISNVPGAKKRRQITQDSDADTNIFEAATQRIAPESPTDSRAKKLRESEKDRKADENIFDAETQQMDPEIRDVSGAKKRRQIADNLAGDVNIFEVATQRMDPESTTEIREKKRRQLAENRENAANIFDAPTQQMDEDLPDLGRSNKSRDLDKDMQDDTDIDLLPTQVLDVPTSTPVSRTRKGKELQSKKSPRLKNEEDLHLAPTQIVNELDDIVDDNSTEDSTIASPKSGLKNTGNAKDNRATVNSTSASRSPKSTGRQTKKNPRSKTKNDSDISPKKIIGNADNSAGKKSSKRSAGGSSSLGDENAGEEKNNRGGNLDETLMRNLGMILGEEANDQELAEESTQIMTQNLVDILRPTQSFEETKSRDSDDDTCEPLSSKRKKIRSSGTLGFRDGHAVGCSRWSDEDPPKATSTMREDKKGDEEETGKKSIESKSSGFKGKRAADETASSTDAESSSSGASRVSKRLQKSTKSVNSKSKATTKRGKESQEVEAILAPSPKKNVPVASKRSYAKVQLTRLDDSDASQQSSTSEKLETPKTNRKRRATMSAKDVTPTSSPASTKSRRTISEGLENRELPKVQHKILLTGLDDEHTKLVKKLGGLVVSEPSKATVLITDKVRRTYKFLCAVARGLQVVSVNWLLESEKAAQFLDCDDFILKDPAAEKLYKFRLEKSLQAARKKKFLQGYSIIVTPKVNQPEIDVLKGIVEASGGKVLIRPPSLRAWNSKTVIVSQKEDITAINALLSKCPKSVKITVQSIEFILTGILRQEVNLVEHKLNIP